MERGEWREGKREWISEIKMFPSFAQINENYLYLGIVALLQYQ